jgi:hypothetical protein
VSGLFAFLSYFGQGDRPLKIANLRFYSAGQDGGGANPSQGEDGKPQGDDPNNKPADTDPGSGDADKDKDDARLSRENARRREENNLLKQQNEELQQRLEALESANLTGAQKLEKEQEKLRKQAADAERKAAESERKLLSSRAVLKHQLPEVLSEMLQGATDEEVDEHASLIKTALEKHYRNLFRPAAPDTEGGDRHDRNASGKLTAEERAKHQREYAKRF